MKKIFLLFLAIMFPIATFASATTMASTPFAGQYKTVKHSPSIPEQFTIPQGKILVVEFFSYGCPWCYQMEPSIEKWLKTKPKYVEFERIPVVFESGWQTYAKAYYTAKALGVLNKMTPAIFMAIHKQGLNLTSQSAMENFFQEHGVSRKDFSSAYEFSPSLPLEIQRASKLMLSYKVFQIPALMVNGKYLTNAALVNGDNKEIIKVLNYLIKKEKTKINTSANK